MSWTRPRAGWEDQKFSSKDVFAGANKRIRPDEELEEGERPVLQSGGLFDVANEIYIKLHEDRKRAEIEKADATAARDAEEFRRLNEESQPEVLSAVEQKPVNNPDTTDPPSIPPPIKAVQNNILPGYSSDEDETASPVKRRPPPAKQLFSKK